MGGDARSRMGCLTCRKRHRKCDEIRPVCIACQQRRLTCEYPSGLRWEQETASKIKDRADNASRTKKRWQARRNAETVTRDESDERNVIDNTFNHGVAPSEKTYHHSSTLPRLQDESNPLLCIIEEPNDYLDQHGDINHLSDLSNMGHQSSDSDQSESSTDSELADGDMQSEHEFWVLDDSNVRANFRDEGERIAFVYYCNYLSRILQAKDDLHNPYRQLSSLATDWPVLWHTILACSSQYMYLEGGVPLRVAASRSEQAIQALRQQLRVMDEDEASLSQSVPNLQVMPPMYHATLAAILLQIAYSAFSNGPEVYGHLSIVHHLLTQWNLVLGPAISWIERFLVQRFAFIDLATAILHRRRPFLSVQAWICAGQIDLDQTEPSFCKMTGCRHETFVVLFRAVHLAADIENNCRGIADMVDEAMDLESTVSNNIRLLGTSASSPRYFACHDISVKEHESDDTINHLKTLNLTFWWVCLIFIQRRLLRDSSLSMRVQRAVRSLVATMKMIPQDSELNSALPLPLYFSGKDMIEEQDRQWIRDRHAFSIRRYPNPARIGMMALTEQIWAKMDVALDRDNFPVEAFSGDGRLLGSEVESDIAQLEKSSKFFVF